MHQLFFKATTKTFLTSAFPSFRHTEAGSQSGIPIHTSCLKHNPNFFTWFVSVPAARRGGGGGVVLGSSFAGYVPLASQNPYPITVYSVASYGPHLSHFWANVIVISRTEFNASRLLKYQNSRNHFSTANLPISKSLLTRIFLSQKSRKFATPFY